MENMKKLTEDEVAAVAGGRHHHHHDNPPTPLYNEQRFPSLGHNPGDLFQNQLNEWFYIAKAGDDLQYIAGKFHCSTDALKIRNPQIVTYISAGDVFYICEDYEVGFLPPAY